MRPFSCLFKVKGGSAGNNLTLEVDIALKHFLKGHDLGTTLIKSQQYCAEGDLKLSIGIKLI